jgi:Leucine-rich repeat (LRR) protein
MFVKVNNKGKVELHGVSEHCDCGDLLITRFSKIPDNLKSLFCYNNLLTELPQLPLSLIKLHCHKNKLTLLHPLPDKLRTLTCHNNPLKNLPPLPQSLEWICISPWQIESGLNNLTNLKTEIIIKN